MDRKRAPEAFILNNLFELGIGYVVVSRFKSNDRVESGVFLLDVFCLGVKDAMFQQLSVADYEDRLLNGLFSTGRQREPFEPACARKLVEQGVRYAARLGFQPHPDYRKACRVFGGIHAVECDREFVFGREGKPCFMQGPNDSPQRTAQIMRMLEASCGKGNFHYVLVVDPSMMPDSYLDPDEEDYSHEKD
ncbi:MAG: hypothetical protein JO069_20975 [Verrucomicrobia bacterium]|nr:hypothetical protein [Verrucomicrobiota bacterium]